MILSRRQYCWLKRSGYTPKVTLTRNKYTNKSTTGKLKVFGDDCVTLEDTSRDIKIYGESCIPAGTYQLKLRTEGGKHESYAKRFDFHRGMIWLQDVPGFTWIYIHRGNSPEDTLGCILVGEESKPDWVSSSTQAYSRIYPLIADAIENGGCKIVVKGG